MQGEKTFCKQQQRRPKESVMSLITINLLKSINITMRKSLLSLGLFMSLSAGMASAQSVLVSDNINVPVGDQNHMFIKSFSETVKSYLETKPRIAIEFVSSNSTVVESGGPWFRGLKKGNAEVRMQIYEESSMKDYPNYEKMLEEVVFQVSVKDEVPATLPKYFTGWGEQRSDVSAAMYELYEPFNETFAVMNPSMSEEDLAPFELGYTGDYEYPLVYSYFNEDGQLLAYYIVTNNANRIGYKSESEVTAALEQDGYELFGYEESMGMPALYNKDTQTLVTGGVVTMQGQYFRYLAFEYDPEDPTGINGLTAEPDPQAKVTVGDGCITIIATDKIAGKTVNLYTMGGQLLKSVRLAAGTNTISVDTTKPVMVKVGRNQTVKVVK